ncbi:hypothetical protein [Kitasatospora sp. NPDC047058]|uniref:hypothetical protein n=1 Tax=Kitasatospora sp. NPDC047058 TaxID=3155620 RepID=UPI0033FFD34F
MSGKHLITDDETRAIAEGFLAASPWLGDVEWSRTVFGPGVEYFSGWDRGPIPEDTELAEGQRWSWTVSFFDPAGTGKTLNHERVLEGLTRIIYGEHSTDGGYRSLAIRQWFTEPAEARQSLKLSTADQSLICQHALYEKTVFPTGEAEALFGKKLDFFADQRPDAPLAEG